jgi:taurine dioxygenase
MASIKVRPLSDALSFGARITGANVDTVRDEGIRKEINDVFWDRGMIVFEEVEPSLQMQVALSEVFGPLQDHALKGVPRADQNATPGMVEFKFAPDDSDIFEVNGTELCSYVPWHFDACYTKELNRAGVLRALEIPPEGGLTGFADGIQLYNAISPELRNTFENLNIIYHSYLMFTKMRFGKPQSYRAIRVRKVVEDLFEQTRSAPRAVHPAIWQRKTGEKVLHVSPWQAAGIEGHEDSDGDALLEALCQDMYARMTPYRHAWKPTDMIIWDNWRFLHSVGGHNPKYFRCTQRTTIQGDYGLGRFEVADTAVLPVGVDV